MLPLSGEKDTRFETEDAPRILDAVRQARQAKSPSSVTITVDGNGGVTTVMLEIKKRIK